MQFFFLDIIFFKNSHSFVAYFWTFEFIPTPSDVVYLQDLETHVHEVRGAGTLQYACISLLQVVDG